MSFRRIRIVLALVALFITLVAVSASSSEHREESLGAMLAKYKRPAGLQTYMLANKFIRAQQKRIREERERREAEERAREEARKREQAQQNEGPTSGEQSILKN
eukprot:TRINITY_DN1039_c0_g1_i2.p1 TRINITY_DN1039_c0_g1~~TRINITY_DN1039_c0_g1_i2.p1  ORF type:complete len:104 (+),score=31.30 TRINITY_DN1039_c0_g1_i2:172-483(+)